MTLRVAAFYRFAPFEAAELPALRRRLLTCAEDGSLRGTVLLAPEGVNGTVSGTAAAVEALLAALRSDPRLASLEVKWADAPEQAFHRFKVRLKREIVTMGDPTLQPYLAAEVGTLVDPGQWDALIDDPDTLVIDTRNAYEVGLGSFAGAIDPGTASFREFPEWVERELRPLVAQHRPRAIALFCTGGIRCEKATAHLLRQGFEGVHHLHGGILRYLEERSEAGSRWRGECFVFDQRVSVNHRLEPGEASLCHACRRPLTAADRATAAYVDGVSCPHCHGRRDAADRTRFAERQKQMLLARSRGERHIGRVFPPEADGA